MWENLGVGRTFDVILVVAANRRHRERLRRLFEGRDGWDTPLGADAVFFASLDELGRPWRGGNFDASLFAVQRIRRLLRKRGIPLGQGRSLAVLVAGQGTRAYPLTAAEGGNKSMIRTPACPGHRPLRLVELVIAQYHQILNDVEPGRIHIAAGDHLLAWEQPPRSAAGQDVQIFASKKSFAEEAEAAGLVDSRKNPLWEDEEDLRRRLAGIDVPSQLPVLDSLTQMGLLRASAEEENLLHLSEKASMASILQTFVDSNGEPRVNWWDWSLSPKAAELLLTQYADVIGRGIDLSVDVLEPVTMARAEWGLRRPERNPELWDRANQLFQNASMSGDRPLGHIGVADPGEGSVFADLGTLQGMHDAFASILERTAEGETYRSLLCAQPEDGVLYVGERPSSAVEVEPGAIVMDGRGIRSGRIGAGSIVVDAKVRELRTTGPCIVYGVRAPSGAVHLTDGDVAAGVVYKKMRHTVRARLFMPSTTETDPTAWSRPQYGNPMSFSDLQGTLMNWPSLPGPGRDTSGPRTPDRTPWRGRRMTHRVSS